MSRSKTPGTAKREHRESSISDLDYGEDFMEPGEIPTRSPRSSRGKAKHAQPTQPSSPRPASKPSRQSTPIGSKPSSLVRVRHEAREESKLNLRPQPIKATTIMSASAAVDPLATITAVINENTMGLNRVLKAAVAFARGAGASLTAARKLVGEDAFTEWVTRTLPLSPAEAASMILYAQVPQIAVAEVSPAKEVPLQRAAELAAILCSSLGRQEQEEARGVRSDGHSRKQSRRGRPTQPR